ncbi:hypothetical protein BO94DRAFT_624406 [Aspergillus sclerotioniger CBS 115572]|uniref:Uncharacterized protein n=1 Tax=Aspergillus sclerotioniger CBS 115572 TaxID=1450535 RepID=A0A317WLL8_9EURO|nr:hypothetical protein BO94DRAFT_624406 [Aspergillus sclerotioniger CBS 115572]PWY87229.1 hypothetical protein BO94DRAFT_624406 [Aspergillus sclerotioniger CBS 115572]
MGDTGMPRAFIPRPSPCAPPSPISVFATIDSPPWTLAMSTYGYENCVAGTFYGFTKTEFNPGDTFSLQWGAIDDGATPLNITLGRAGGYIIDEIIVGAQFTKTSALYQLVVDDTANCTLEEFSWAIPDDFNTTDPQYQIGLFNASVLLGADGVPLFGWQAWNPDFYVRPVSSTTTTDASSTTSTVAATATGGNTTTTTSATSLSTFSASPTSSSVSDDSTSNSETIGIGVGVGVGVAALAAVLLGAFYLRRRRKKAQTPSQGLGGVRQQYIQELPATEKRPPMHELAG